MNKIIKFYSEWCGPCKVMSENLKKLPGNVNIKDINIEEDEEGLVDKYGIKTIPTIIVLNDEDTIVETFYGITPIEKIIDAITRN